MTTIFRCFIIMFYLLLQQSASECAGTNIRFGEKSIPIARFLRQGSYMSVESTMKLKNSPFEGGRGMFSQVISY